MTTPSADGLTEVEIPSLTVTGDDEEYSKVESAADFETLVRAMGWENTVQFESQTGVTADELIGNFWMTLDNRVYRLPEED
jgi:hypothetical protein